ncbi:MAG: hypothetical protein PHD09_05165 [Candidatus Omnitrophica bacterium]|nr:hypothetical protein [Candidatus Omnitrophota bacterium]
MRKVKLIILFILVFLSLYSYLFAGIVTEGWKDPRSYRPNPVLFLHGFGSGTPQGWVNVDTSLSQYYVKYYTGYHSDPSVLPKTRYPYLELIDFGSSTEDRNSSIDTYKAGDCYVTAGLRVPGDPGWADKLDGAVIKLRQYYKYADDSEQKIILVGHSMSGLAARKYLKDYTFAYQKISKLIMIGTPNRGALDATAAVILHRSRLLGMASYIYGMGLMSVAMIEDLDRTLEENLQVDIDGDAVWDMDPEITGSGFIDKLNFGYACLIDHFVIIGKHWLFYNLGDGTVSNDSQLGTGVLSLKSSATISALHGNELDNCVTGNNPLLRFLDYTPPEFTITSPPTNSEISTDSIHIKGMVYKEYLPADTNLIIKIIRQEDGLILPEQKSLLQPSDLWIPNNPNSPVAEFDTEIIFPGLGLYYLSCVLENPARITSEKKELWVKVTGVGEAQIIVHCHNPEGKEIASIQGISEHSIPIYEGETVLGYGASDAQSHNQPIALTSGSHEIKVEFNGKQLTRQLDLSAGETKEIIFEFPREQFDLIEAMKTLNCSLSAALSGTYDGLQSLMVDSKVFSVAPGWQAQAQHECISADMFGEYALNAQMSFSLVDKTIHWRADITADKTDSFRGSPYPVNSRWSSFASMQAAVINITADLEGYGKWFLQGNGSSLGDLQIKVSEAPLAESYHIAQINPGILALYIKNKQFSYKTLDGTTCKKEQLSSNSFRYTGSYSQEGSSQLNIRLSSVPYDLLNTGI